MNGPAIVIQMLLANQGLLAVVPADKIFPGLVKVNTVLPAVAVTEVSCVESKTLSANSNKRYTVSRVQVTTLAKTYGQKRAVVELVRRALPNFHGTLAGVDVEAIIPEPRGPDLENAEASISMQTQDYMVSFQSVAPG